jgi:hypothetical protein
MCADLGQVKYVLSDKTGTLTKNLMVVQHFSIAEKVFGDPITIDGGEGEPPITSAGPGAGSCSCLRSCSCSCCRFVKMLLHFVVFCCLLIFAQLCVVQHYPTLLCVVQHYPTLLCVVQHYPTLLCVVQHYPTLLCVVQHYPPYCVLCSITPPSPLSNHRSLPSFPSSFLLSLFSYTRCASESRRKSAFFVHQLCEPQQRPHRRGRGGGCEPHALH